MTQPACSPAGVRRRIAAVLTCALASTAVAAAPPEPAGTPPAVFTAHLEPIWTAPLTRDPAKPTAWPMGFVPGAWAEAPDGALVLLGTMSSPGRVEQLILHNAERSGPEAAVPLALPASAPEGLQRNSSMFGWPLKPNLSRGIVNVAPDADGGFWLGGWINQFLDIGSAPHGDAYVAKLDATGRTIWHRAYSDKVELSISSIAPKAGGGAVVAGSGWLTSWLARISPDGTRLEEWRLGNGKGIGIVPLQDGRILVAGFADGGVAAGAGSGWEAAQAAVRAGTYRDDAVAWMLGETGQPQGPVLVREGISQGSAHRGPGDRAGSIAVTAADNAAYVATNWFDVTRPAGVEVARIGPDGTALWRQSLLETVEPMDAKRLQSCSPALTALPNGDALVACALNGRVQLHRLDGKTGERTFASLAPPPCQRGGYASGVSLIARRDGMVFVLGSGFGDDGGIGCSWMAQLIFNANEKR